ncbi:MAG TPA: substrate-binding domain-containing protein, partial [Burkholderiales bacterium]|nr:substrate-binding domain-containing protein [Burkholderiales bacterium]
IVFGAVAAAVSTSTLGHASAAEIRVYSGGAAQEVLRVLGPEFEQQTGHRVAFTFRLVTEIQRMLAEGDQADVVLLPIPLLAATQKTRAFRPEGPIVLARVGIGLIVRQGQTHPDISTPEAVRRMLLEARRIALPTASVPSGRHLTRIMAELGIADAVSSKLLFRAAIDGGPELVAKGEADIGLYLVSEVHTTKDVSVVGLLPPPFQNFVVYAAALPVDSAAPDAAVAFLKFVSDPAKAERWKASGFELER